MIPINPKTGKAFERGDIIKTKWGLVARYWARHPHNERVILVRTVPDSNTWQHSLRVECLVR